MQISRLSLNHVRVFEQAEFDFQPGMNLIVGVNGSGKSTVLEALCIMLSKALPKLTASKSQSLSFNDTDITIGQDVLTAELDFLAHGQPFEANLQREYGEDSFELRPNRRDILGDFKKTPEQPLAVYFSVHRSLANVKKPRKSEVAEGQAAAFVSSLSPHELRLRTIGYWWLKQEAIARESGSKLPKRHLEVLREAVTLFLDNCSDFHVEREELPKKLDKDGKVIEVPQPEPELFINKGATKLNVRHLSEGERGVLALVLDLARRLSLANPYLENPLAEGEAVVLIDELDLHLHPRWQRTVVEKLTRTFQNCQFIVTSHSPFIIQSLHEGNLINLSSNNRAVAYADQSIEDITEEILGVDLPQKSQRYQDMMAAAEEYYQTLEKTENATDEELGKLKHKLDELSVPYSEDPAFTAFLKFQRARYLREENEAD